MHTLKPSSSDTKLPSSDLLQDGLRIGHPGAGHCLRGRRGVGGTLRAAWRVSIARNSELRTRSLAPDAVTY